MQGPSRPPPPPLADDDLERGNSMFRRGNFQAAVRLYTTALASNSDSGSVGDETRNRVLSNRAAAFLRLRCWSQAQSDALCVLSNDESHSKSKYRLATALLHLQEPAAALEIAAALVAESPEQLSDPSFAKLEADAARALQEQREGTFDLAAITREAVAGERSERPFHADFISGIELGVACGEAGRGARATRPLRENELLLFEAAFATVTVESEADSKADSEAELACGARLAKAVSTAIGREPKRAKEVYALTAAAELDAQSALAVSVDIERATL